MCRCQVSSLQVASNPDQITDKSLSPFTVNSANALPKPANKPTETVSKRSLNLEDYKKKRGLI